jgi:hypothetical protein
MEKRDPEELLTPARASRLLDLTPDPVRPLADNGRLMTAEGRKGV